MKAVEQFGYGDAHECMRWIEVDVPTPAPNEVLIKGDYVGIRWGDIMGRTGDPEPRYGEPPFKLIAGAEIAGTVEAIGSEVTKFKPGDRVFGAPRGGGYAEYAAVLEDRTTPIPDNVPLDSACCYPVNMRAAYFLVYPWGKVKSGDKILLHAAAGGVGQLVTQVIKRRIEGVTLIGLAGSDEKVQFCYDNGIDYAINYKTHDYVHEVGEIVGHKTKGIGAEFDAGGVDLVFNSVRGPTTEKDPKVITKRGRWILYGASAGRIPIDTVPFTYDGITIMPYSNMAWYGQPEHEDARKFIQEWMRTEELIQPTVFDFADLIDVQAKMQAGGTVGKVVLKV
ncbi:MAG: zinc-binding alcohol dehydrogenase family protein [Maricaulaceae bacterium]|jgi:NADPH2:quinone reductase